MLPTIVVALVRRGDRMLMVRGKGSDDPAPGWMLPGGRVEPGEELREALARELAEETGLELRGELEVAFEVEVDYDSDVVTGRHRSITYTCDAVGKLRPDDPDGLVDTAEWLDRAVALDRLGELEWYEREPLRRFLAGEAPAGASYRYRVSGARGRMVRGDFSDLGRRFDAFALLYHVASGKVLLHERDEYAPVNPNKWGLFGGGGEDEDDGDPITTLRRELREELGIAVEPDGIVPLCEYLNRGRVDRYVYYCAWPSLSTDFVLGEGRSFAWVGVDDALQHLDLSDGTRRDLLVFKKRVISGR